MVGLRANLRLAEPDDAEALAALLNPYARDGLVLPRSPQEIREHAGSFLIALHRARIIGCVALRDYGNGLQEIRSLAVHPDHNGHGLGSKLVRAVTKVALARGADRIFTLTLRPHLFARLGFEQVDKDLFPQKVWTDCRKCAKREACDEIALLKARARGAGAESEARSCHPPVAPRRGSSPSPGAAVG